MTQTTFGPFQILSGGVGQTGLTVLLSDPTGTYGIKRTDTDAVVVADGTAATEIGGGYYSHTFTDPAADLSYDGWVEYVVGGATTRSNNLFAGTSSDPTTIPATRVWDSLIPYEDRALYTTSRWRLTGIVTKHGSVNTDNGVLWAKFTRSVDTVTVNLYKDDGLASGNLVATGSADVSATDNTGTNAAEVVFAESNSSGITGQMWIHQYGSDGSNPIQVSLCVDEDMDVWWDAVEDLTVYDSTYGLAEPIRVATGDVMALVMRMFQDNVGGFGAAEAWYIKDATRFYPDLRRIANPDQLRNAATLRALVIAIGRDHERAQDTAYSELRDYFQGQYDDATSSLQLAFKPGDSGDASESGNAVSLRLNRV